MNTKWLWAFAVAVALAGTMWQFGGFGALFSGTAPGDQLSSGEEFNETAGNEGIQENFTGDATAQSGDLVGLFLSSIGRFADLIGFLVFLPYELLALGLPSYAVEAIAQLVSMFAAIALVLFAGNRVWP